MANDKLFTIESFYSFVKEKKLMGGHCRSCGNLLVPPKPLCPKCFSDNLAWTEISKKGTLQTYTIIHVAPKQFQAFTPYAVGIVELQDGAQLPGMIRNIALDKIQVGMQLRVDFDTEQMTNEWPHWPRYYFEPAHPQ